MAITINSRFGGTALKIVEAETLRGANLGGADLRGADLGGAYLRGADLGGADLRGAYLRGADLGGADLRGADLGGASLGGADLGGADLRRAILTDAILNWTSHALVAELLLRAAGEDVDKRMVAGLIAVSLDWCWKEFLPLDLPLKDWALDTLAPYVREGDSAPKELVERAAAKRAERGEA